MKTGALSTHRLTANQMATKVSELLDDPNRARFSAAKVLEGLNNAIADFSILSRFKYDGVDVEFTADQRDYNIITFIDAGAKSELGYVARIGKYDGSTQDFPYEFLKGDPLMKLDRYGLTTLGTGMAEAWHKDMVDYHQLSIVPIPEDDFTAGPPKNHGVYVLYVAVADLMTYSAPDFGGLDADIPTLAQLPICYGAAAMILEYGGADEVKRAQDYFKEFYKGIDSCIASDDLAKGEFRSMRAL